MILRTRSLWETRGAANARIGEGTLILEEGEQFPEWAKLISLPETSIGVTFSILIALNVYITEGTGILTLDLNLRTMKMQFAESTVPPILHVLGATSREANIFILTLA